MYRLIRLNDGLIKTAPNVKWIEFDEYGYFAAQHNEIEVDRCLLLYPLNNNFTWQTTLVTEIIEQRKDYIKFKTENSIYELFKL
jgi:hypothetical protein